MLKLWSLGKSLYFLHIFYSHIQFQMTQRISQFVFPTCLGLNLQVSRLITGKAMDKRVYYGLKYLRRFLAFLSQQKLIRNSVRLYGPLQQLGGSKTANRSPCSVPVAGASWFLIWGKSRDMSRGWTGRVVQLVYPPLWWGENRDLSRGWTGRGT